MYEFCGVMLVSKAHTFQDEYICETHFAQGSYGKGESKKKLLANAIPTSGLDVLSL